MLEDRVVPSNVPPAGITDWWTGDGRADDIIGGRNGTLVGGATTGPGLVDQAFVLNGQSAFVNVPDNAALNVGTGNFTVELWVKFNNTNEQVLAEKYIETLGSSSTGWTLTKLSTNVLRLALTDGTHAPINVDSTALSIPTNTWIEFAAERSGSTITTFMNGNAVASGTCSYNLNSTASLKLGHRGNPTDTPGSADTRNFYLNGAIDEVQYYVGTALSNSQIQAIHNDAAAGESKPLAVSRATPAADSVVVGTAPTDFAVHFSEAYAAASLQASDFNVNGIAANSVSSTGTNDATFHFNTTPVTVQGLQTMQMSAGSVSAADTTLPASYQSLEAWTKNFRYAAVQMQVSSTSPSAGGVINFPNPTLQVNLNEAYDPSTVGIGNLTLNQGTVTGFTLSADHMSVIYSLRDLFDTSVNVSIAAGALTDAFGNPMLAYSATYGVNFAAGKLDPTFGTGGIVSTFLLGTASKSSTSSDGPSDVVVQPDGKILEVGAVNMTFPNKTGATQCGLARYNANGTLDSSFGSGGIVVTGSTSSGSNIAARRVALQPDGKIDVLVPGWSVLQFNANGTLDTTFGNKGQATVSLGGQANDLVIQPPAAGKTEGKIVLAGAVNSNYGVVGLARLNPGGSLDTSFGNGGTVTTTIGPGTKGYGAWLATVALQSNGQILVAGSDTLNVSTSTGDFIVARYNSNGSLDPTFGTGGIVQTSIPGLHSEVYSASEASKVLVQPADGKILAVGLEYLSNDDFQTGYQTGDIVRYNPDGSLDTSFGNGGIVVNSTNGGFDDAAIGNDGSIIATSSSDPAASYDQIRVARYLANSATINGVSYPAGSLDPSFGSSGQLATPLFSSDAVAIQPDGKIVISGNHQANGPGRFNLIRLLPSEPEIASFTAGTNPVTAGSSETLTASSITDGNAGATIAQVAFYLDSNSDGILEPGTDTLLGYGTQTSPGVWSYTFTVTQATGNYTLFAQAKDSYGVFGDPVALTLTVS